MEYPPPVEERREPDAGELRLLFPTVRRPRRQGGRSLFLLAAAAALVVGMQFVLTATPSASADPAEAPASVAGTTGPETRVTEAPRVTIAPARVTTAPARVTITPARVLMTPGPAFAGSVPARPGADSPRTRKAKTPAPAPARAPAAAPAAAPAPAPAEPSIAPAPAAIELTLPGLPPEAVVPTARAGDTMGMKRILRALNGAKPAEASAAP